MALIAITFKSTLWSNNKIKGYEKSKIIFSSDHERLHGFWIERSILHVSPLRT